MPMNERLRRQKRNQRYHSLRASDVASCNRRVVNGMIRLGVESVMVAHDEILSILVPHPHVNMKY